MDACRVRSSKGDDSFIRGDADVCRRSRPTFLNLRRSPSSSSSWMFFGEVGGEWIRYGVPSSNKK